nr:MAG TPA: hypothetical protein [Bacteriophage sp.]
MKVEVKRSWMDIYRINFLPVVAIYYSRIALHQLSLTVTKSSIIIS